MHHLPLECPPKDIVVVVVVVVVAQRWTGIRTSCIIIVVEMMTADFLLDGTIVEDEGIQIILRIEIEISGRTSHPINMVVLMTVETDSMIITVKGIVVVVVETGSMKEWVGLWGIWGMDEIVGRAAGHLINVMEASATWKKSQKQ